jgi:hypothetical protein
MALLLRLAERWRRTVQYAVALEPTTSACNTLAKAQETNSAILLKAGETYDWEIRFGVRETVLFDPTSPT